VLHRALGAPSQQVVFITTEARALAVEEASFVPLETALLEAKPWEPLVADAIELALNEAPVDLKLGSLGAFPLGAADAPPEPPPAAPALPPK
jgi:hypothetical protein